MKTISKLQEEEPTFSSMSRSSGKRKPPDDNNYYAESLLHEKRQRVFSEAHKDSCGDGKKFEFLSETHFSTAKKNSRVDFRNSKKPGGSERCKRTMDRSTRLQCWTILKRLMIHPDGVAFRKPEYHHHHHSPSSDDSETKEASTMVGLEAIQWKLDKGMYLKADEFADEIRLMLSNVKLYDSKIRGIHRMAMKLREEFEKRWESMKERWASTSTSSEKKKVENKSNKRDNSIGEKCPKVATFSQGQKRVSCKLESSKVVAQICTTFLGQPYSADEKLIYFPKNKIEEKANTWSLSRPKSASVLRKSDTDPYDGVMKEFKKQNGFSKADSERKEAEEEGHERAERIKKEREAARVALEEMKRTVEFGDDMQKYEELLELLYDQNPMRSWYLKSVGLYLKD